MCILYIGQTGRSSYATHLIKEEHIFDDNFTQTKKVQIF